MRLIFRLVTACRTVPRFHIGAPAGGLIRYDGGLRIRVECKATRSCWRLERAQSHTHGLVVTNSCDGVIDYGC